jgi:FHA domain
LDPRAPQNLKPAEIVNLLRASNRVVFESTVGTSLLLVRIDDPQSDFAITLEAALEDASTMGGQKPEPSLGFDTVVGTLPASLESFLLAARIARAQFSGPELTRRLARTVHIAVPLHKRPGASNVFSERISVGRARTNDIVLRHHSVSKFQAWFEKDEDDRFLLAGGKATNPTLMNGIEVPRGSPVAVASGDEIRFGDVSAVFCEPGLLWDALMAPPPSTRSVLPPSSRRPPPSNRK